MLMKAINVANVPMLDQVPVINEVKDVELPNKLKFMVVGHRGNGMNAVSSTDRRLNVVKENSLLSFNRAGRFPIDLVEFDVQVTSDGYPVIFHDDFILTEEAGVITEKPVTQLSLEEFLSYGPQKQADKVGKLLLRRSNDGKASNWNVEDDDSLCTLQEVFQKVDSHLGFNIELKFDDYIVYQDQQLISSLQSVLQVVNEYANGRPIIFSTFQPDAAHWMRKLQSIYPVYFLTNGGTEIFDDIRRNSLEEAIKLCLASGLQGIVSDVKGIFKNPLALPKIKESNLSLLTYGQLNNVPEAVYLQHLMGINGVIVDLVKEITEAVSDFSILEPEQDKLDDVEVLSKKVRRPNFSQQELSFLFKLIPELV